MSKTRRLAAFSRYAIAMPDEPQKNLFRMPVLARENACTPMMYLLYVSEILLDMSEDVR